MKQRIGTACLGVFLLASITLGQTATPSGTKVVACVNGVNITLAELEAVLKTGDPTPIHLPEAQRRQRQMEALAMLIDNVLMRQFLEKYSKPVSAEEVDRKLREMRAGLAEQGKSLEEFCQETNQSLSQLKSSIADHLRWNAFAAANISDGMVEKYYSDNKDFFDGVTVRASHIVLRLSTNATETEKARAREKLTEIRQKLISDPKSDFAEMAKQYSQDPMASKGGDLGWIPRKWFDESFSRAAFALPVGQISDIVQTDYGMHLIKVTDRKPGRPSEFAKIKEGVREFCAEDMRQQLLSRARKEAKITIDLP